MHLIEPCCAQKNLRELRYAIKDGGTAQFEGYGDLSLSELLGPLVTRYNGVEIMIAAPTLPDQAAEIIEKWMKLTWARMDGQGSVWRIQHLTVIADLSSEKSPVASTWLNDNPFGERMMLHDIQQDSTAILLPDFAITGPVNMRYGHHFVATATTDPEEVKELWESYMEMTENAPEPDVETTEPDAETTKSVEEQKPAKKRKKQKSKK